MVLLRLAVVAIHLILCAGCTLGGTAGSLRTASLGDDAVILQGNFKAAHFSHELKGDTAFVLSNVTPADLAAGAIRDGQYMHIQLLWMPAGGSTPMDPTATNASIRYVIIAQGEVGVYSGAGFALPDGDLDGKRASLTLRDATLQLQASTAGFNDLLSPAQMTGSFTATKDHVQTEHLKRAMSQFVTNALGRTTLVRAY